MFNSVFRACHRFALVALLSGFGLASDTSFGQDSKDPAAQPAPTDEADSLKKAAVPVEENKPSQPVKEGDEPAKAPEKKKAKKSIQQTLQDELLGKVKDQLENPVEAILERMRHVQERLEKTATDKEIRQEQATIVQEIDKLIEALKNQPPPPPSSSSDSNSPPPPPMGGQDDKDQQAQGTPQPRPQNSQKQQDKKQGQSEKDKQQGQKQQQQPGQTETVSDKARDSNSPSSKRPRSAEEEAFRQRMLKDVWGQLPPSMRQELLNIFSEKYIPKYDEQVRRYYEALSEQNREP